MKEIILENENLEISIDEDDIIDITVCDSGGRASTYIFNDEQKKLYEVLKEKFYK